MLASQYKLNSVEFKKVFNMGKKIHTDNYMVIYLSGQKTFKCATVVSKKHAKTAIMRNHKRRQIFNSVAVLRNNKPESLPDIWMIVIIKKKSLSIGYTQILTELQQVIHKI